MPLEAWIALSGAAFSTGIGAQTSMALSLVCGLFNVRTGYWWRSGAQHRVGRNFERLLTWLLPVQSFLLNEWLARFPGTTRNRWYLSDGGHFENSACYELVRRRVDLIVLCDNGEDPDFLYEDLANLARKARLDFAAEITFLTDNEIEKFVDPMATPWVGSLERLRRGGNRADPSHAHAAVARIVYADGKRSTLLVIKPSLMGDEPVDIQHYHRANPDFPHEPTIDQFFDEAQWESYRRLGRHIGDKLFAIPPVGSGKWVPGELKPL